MGIGHGMAVARRYITCDLRNSLEGWPLVPEWIHLREPIWE